MAAAPAGGCARQQGKPSRLFNAVCAGTKHRRLTLKRLSRPIHAFFRAVMTADMCGFL